MPAYSFPDMFETTFSPDLSAQQVESFLRILADYYRACGGVGFRSEFELADIPFGELAFSSSGKNTRIIACIRPLFPGDWMGIAGRQFRKTIQAISDFAEENHITPGELLHSGVSLGRRKLEDSDSHEYTAILKGFVEEERIRLETEVQKRALDNLKNRTTEARNPEAGALFAEISAADLLRKLQDAEVVLHKDVQGVLTALPIPTGVSLGDLLSQMALPAQGNVTKESDGIHVRGAVLGPLSFPGNLVIVEPSARVHGDLHAGAIRILAGAEVRGNVHGTTHVEIRRNGRLIGDVRSAKITIEGEALFRGGVDITKSDL